MDPIEKLKVIADGWKNVAFANPEIEVLAKKRANICVNECGETEESIILQAVIGEPIQEIKGMKCANCGCPLSSATRSPNYSCIKGKW